jgi:anionic cell wall polymer biosynthesis LytR-Cps2A-Psr (LCP) family protein
MRRTGIDRSLILLAVIIAVVVGTVILVLTYVQTDEITDAIEADRLISVLIVVQLDEAPLVTEVFFYQPSTHRGAVFDIPANTGAVVAELNRVDSVDEVFFTSGAGAYREAIATILGEPIDYHIVLDERQLTALVDFAEGVPIFVADLPNEGPDAILIPSGDVILDGAKTAAYAAYSVEGERDRERIARHQGLVIDLLERLGEQADLFSSYRSSRVLIGAVQTNLERSSLVSFIEELSFLEGDRVIKRQVEGTIRSVDIGESTESLLFPHQEGRWLIESVRQVVENLASQEAIRDENIVIRLEILNGTDVSGLAARTAERYRSFGFDVVAVGNATSDDVVSTLVIDRQGNEVFAQRTADIIGAHLIETDMSQQAAVDVTVILGKDFDGTYVR